MERKEKIKLGGVSETLLITLNARGRDAVSGKPVLNDRKSAEIMSEIDYDFSKFDDAWLSYYGILARAKIMDREIQKFIEKHPDCVIVSLGCGLDTRFLRVDNGQIEWYNLDFPEVIRYRKKFFEENERVKHIEKSALDPEWTENVGIKNGKKLLIVSEGVLMYLSEEEIRKLLKILTDSFSSFEAHFDLLYKGNVKESKKHDALSKMNAEFKWGVTDGSEITKLNPEIMQTGYFNFTDEMRHLLPGWKKIMIPFLYWRNNRLGIYRHG